MVKVHCLLLVLLLTLPLWAQPSDRVSVSLSSSSIAMDETATLTISVSGLANDLDIPHPSTMDDGLRFTYTGRTRSHSIINGNMTSSEEVRYTITPLRTGRHLIEPIIGTVAGIPFATSTQRLEVTDVGTGTGVTTSNQPIPSNPWGLGSSPTWPPQPIIEPPREDDVLLEAEVEPAVVYNHQPAYYNLRLLTAVRLLSDPRYSPINPTGFLRIAFPQENSNVERNGRVYNVMSVKTAYFPLSEGEYSFDASQVSVSGGLFSMPQTLTTGAKTLKVLPLPGEGRPQSFTGAVGQQFEIRAHLKSPEIALGGTSELEVTVKGDGHLDLVPYPYLPEWKNLEKKQLSSPSTTKVENGQIVSLRTYNFRIKPTRAGTFDLSGIALGYFNPTEIRYEVVKTPSLTLTVEPNKNASTAETSSDNEVAESDRPLENPGPTNGRLPQLPLGPLAAGLALLLAGALMASPGKLLPGSRRPRGKAVSARHKTLGDLMAALETLAPGSDSNERSCYLQGKGWSPHSIAKLENLKRTAGRAVFGSAQQPDADVLEGLNKELGDLLKETRR